MMGSPEILRKLYVNERTHARLPLIEVLIVVRGGFSKTGASGVHAYCPSAVVDIGMFSTGQTLNTAKYALE